MMVRHAAPTDALDKAGFSIGASPLNRLSHKTYSCLSLHFLSKGFLFCNTTYLLYFTTAVTHTPFAYHEPAPVTDQSLAAHQQFYCISASLHFLFFEPLHICRHAPLHI